MASIYKNRNVWYLSVTINKNRATRSLRTSDYKVAKQLKPYIESQLILELTGLKKRTSTVPFPDLAAKYLKQIPSLQKTPKSCINIYFVHISTITHYPLTQIPEQYSLELLMLAGTGD